MNTILFNGDNFKLVGNFLWKYVIKDALHCLAVAAFLFALVGVPLGGLFFLAYLGDLYHPAFFIAGGPIWIAILGNVDTACKAIDKKWFNDGKKKVDK